MSIATAPQSMAVAGRRSSWSARLRPRSAWQLSTGICVWSATVAVLGWAAVRVLGLERGRGVQWIAFTPYVAAASLLPVVAALGLRRWRAVAAATVAAGVLAGCVLPRWSADADATAVRAGGPHLRVMTSNLLEGMADPVRIVALVRRYRIDVLALQEYTAEAERALAAAGLDDVLAHRVAFPEAGVTGSALYARHALTGGVLHRHAASGFGQAAATLAVPGAAALAVESVHPCAPSDPGLVPAWRADLGDLAPATPHGRMRIMLGDFNATADHAALRDLLATGYRDAADTLGAGLVPSWPYDGRRVPWVTLDHVLADRRVGVQSVSVHRIPHTDHRAVIADLILPPE